MTGNKEDRTISETIYQIYDKIFKKILTLSAQAVILFINGLFGTAYPLDSKITYNWTEFEDEKLKKVLADTIITINDKYSYHLEAQMEKDNSIVFRVFEYGFGHANRTREMKNGRYILRFPKPVIIYLYYEGNVPDSYELAVEFSEDEAPYIYTVPVIKLPEISAKELNDRKMVILIPFHLLKLRKMLKEKNISEHINELRDLVENDIIGSIEMNRQMNNITMEDAYKLKSYTQKLWNHLLLQYKELEVPEDMTDESFMTDIDLLCEEYAEKFQEYDKRMAEYHQRFDEYEKRDAEYKQKFGEYKQKCEEYEQKCSEYEHKIQQTKEDSYETGRMEGEKMQIISLVCRKLAKGKTADVIAEELEENIEEIVRICDVAKQFSPKYNERIIFKELYM